MNIKAIMAATAALAIPAGPRRMGGGGETMFDLFDRIAPRNFNPKLRWPTPPQIISLRREKAEVKRARKSARRLSES